ncbi:MAG: hypothetical protein KDD41_01530 [Flavobacteriales bacterium]|nr:hypothetical protein [Flavobacteriales bacterium]
MMLIIIVLAIRERARKKENPEKYHTLETTEDVFTEKDVLMMDKKILTPPDDGYRHADKSKFSYIIFILIFLIGLALVLIFSPFKDRPENGVNVGGGSVIKQDNTKKPVQ